VTSVPVYPVDDAFDVSAGLAPFDVAYSSGYSQGYLQYLAYSQTPSLFDDPYWVYSIDSGGGIAPGCLMPENNCSSYLFVGGLEIISPYPSLQAGFPGADVYLVFGEQGVQADYWNSDPSDASFENDSCQIWGTGLPIMICIKASSLDLNDMVWGIDFPV